MTRQATKLEILLLVKRLLLLKRRRDMPTDITEAYAIALDGLSLLALEAAVNNMLKSREFMPMPFELRHAAEAIENPNQAREARQRAQRFDEDSSLTPGQKLGYPLLKKGTPEALRANALWEKAKAGMGAPGSQFAPADRAARKLAKRLFKAMKTGHGATPDELRAAGFVRHADEMERRGGPVYVPEPEEPDDETVEHEDVIAKQIAQAKLRDQQRNPRPAITEAEQMERIRQIAQEPVQPTEALLRSLRNPMNQPRG